MLFDENGILNIDEMVEKNASFQRIMADGVVTAEELKAQAEKIISLLHDMESKYSEEQLSEVKSLLAESGALYAAYNLYTLQTLNL